MAQLGSAHAWGAWGRRFKSCHPDFFLNLVCMKKHIIKILFVGISLLNLKCEKKYIDEYVSSESIESNTTNNLSELSASHEVRNNILFLSNGFKSIVRDQGYSNEYFGTHAAFDYKDFNLDGYKDLILITNFDPEIGHVAGVFLWNQANFRFEDLATHIMIGKGDPSFHGKTVYDFDQDGDMDVYIPVSNYHGRPDFRPDYYTDGGWRYPGSFFINNGNNFEQKLIDTAKTYNGNNYDYPAFDQGFIIDTNNDLKKELLIPVINSGYPPNQEFVFNNVVATANDFNINPSDDFFFKRYSINQNGDISKELVFEWKGETRYKGAYHSLLIKDKSDKLYVYCQPEEIYDVSEDNHGSYTYPEVWIYEKNGNYDSDSPVKIKLNRNTNLANAGQIINHDTFYIEDLNNDGIYEIIIGMMTFPIVNGEHFSIHIFDIYGNEITDQWFLNREFIDRTSTHANGFQVNDFNNDGFIDILTNNRFNSLDSEMVLFMNTGNSFKQLKIDTGVNDHSWRIPIDIDNDSTYEFLNFIGGQNDVSESSVSLIKVDFSQLKIED